MPDEAQTADQAKWIRDAKAAAPDLVPPKTPRNLIVCCDGTGNEFGASNTNVVRLYGYLVKGPTLIKRPDPVEGPTQLTYYDPGVGTLSPPNLMTQIGRFVARLWGLAFGLGITADIEEAYTFLMNNHQPGDRVFLFGFSRGAYTVRALAGMIHLCGLLPKGNDNLIRYVTKMYLHGTPNHKEDFKAFFTGKNECKPHYVGVFDTVNSVSFFIPKVFPNSELNPDVRHGRHALSIDERRGMYEAFPWSPPPKDVDQEIKQVWFTGVHSDVGGGYPDSERGLSDIALEWMLREAEAEGLVLLDKWEQNLKKNPEFPPHNPLHPWWWMLPFRRRAIPKNADFHEPAKKRNIGPVSFLSWFLGGVPSFIVLAVFGFLAAVVWFQLLPVAGWAYDVVQPVWACVRQWLFGLTWYWQGAVGAGATVLLGLGAWGVRHWNTKVTRSTEPPSDPADPDAKR